ncbi:MAG: IS3 family transposase [Pseudomonadota bacterium]|nr:IS3 family transposase [Pseudomonadota bacterium]
MSLLDRKHLSGLIEEAVIAGARRSECCKILEFSVRTLQRWEKAPDQCDQRCGPKTVSLKQFTKEERIKIIEIANSTEYRNLPPSQIVPRLADFGIYLASESSFYRILKRENLDAHRLNTKPRTHLRPAAVMATVPNQLWSWDITYLKSPIRGQYFFLYMIMDIFSRMIVGSEVYACESAEYAAVLIADAAGRQQVQQDQLTLHSDNGGPMKGATMLATLQKLGVVPSFSRPKVSDDNPFSESLFKTLKYRPSYPDGAFASLREAREWVDRFVSWYNFEHQHSEISFVTPASKHHGQDLAILQKRTKIYEEARAKNPQRWSKNIRKWNQITEVYLNPTKEIRQAMQTAAKPAA